MLFKLPFTRARIALAVAIGLVAVASAASLVLPSPAPDLPIAAAAQPAIAVIEQKSAGMDDGVPTEVVRSDGQERCSHDL